MGASIRLPFRVQVRGGKISNLTFEPLFPRLTQALVAVFVPLGDSWESLTLSPASASRGGLG